MVDYGLKRWDIAATRLLIEEAGGRYTCLHTSRHDGEPIYGFIGGKPAVVDWPVGIFR